MSVAVENPTMEVPVDGSVKETRFYTYRLTNQAFSENGVFDHRPERESWGFSFYSWGKWHELNGPTNREELAKRLENNYITNRIKRDGGGVQILETIKYESTVIEGDYRLEKEKFYRKTIVTTFEESVVYEDYRTYEETLSHFQWKADMDDYNKMIMAELDARIAAEKAEAETVVEPAQVVAPKKVKRSIFSFFR